MTATAPSAHPTSSPFSPTGGRVRRAAADSHLLGDEDAAKRYLIEYISMGGTKRGIKQSLRRMHPLGGLTERERKLFVAGLRPQDRELVAKAEAYYREVLLGEGE